MLCLAQGKSFCFNVYRKARFKNSSLISWLGKDDTAQIYWLFSKPYIQFALSIFLSNKRARLQAARLN